MNGDIVPAPEPEKKVADAEVISPEEPWINGFNFNSNRESIDSPVFSCQIKFRGNHAGCRKVVDLLKELQKKHRLEGSGHMHSASVSAWEPINE